MVYEYIVAELVKLLKMFLNVLFQAIVNLSSLRKNHIHVLDSWHIGRLSAIVPTKVFHSTRSSFLELAVSRNREF